MLAPLPTLRRTRTVWRGPDRRRAEEARTFHAPQEPALGTEPLTYRVLQEDGKWVCRGYNKL